MLACSSVQQYPVLDCVTDGFTRAVRKRAWSNVLVMQTLAVTWGQWHLGAVLVALDEARCGEAVAHDDGGVGGCGL